MKNIFSNVNIDRLPNMFYNMLNDLKKYFNQLKDKTTPPVIDNDITFGQIYFEKNYQLDLWGWSGLSQWYLDLLDRKRINTDVQLYKNIYLDPTLCIRRIQDNELKQLTNEEIFNKNLKTMHRDKNLLKCTFLISQKTDNNNQSLGRYIQDEMTIAIQYNKLQKMQKKLYHQFVHFLDHLTAYLTKYNVKKIKKHIDLQRRKDDQNLEQFYTKRKYIDNSQFLKKQFESKYIEKQLQFQDICIDCAYYSNDYNVNIQILLYMCYLLEYNFENKQSINRSNIESQISTELLELFKYLISLNNHYLFSQDLNHWKITSEKTYQTVMNRFYNKFCNLYLKPTELSKKIL